MAFRRMVVMMPLRRTSTPLIQTIQSLSVARASGKVNPLNWTDEIMRLTHLDTLSTTGHPSTTIQNEKSALTTSTALQFLQAGASLKQLLAAGPQTPASKAKELMKDARATAELADAIKEGEVQAESSW